jgi:hypothetical protein
MTGAVLGKMEQMPHEATHVMVLADYMHLSTHRDRPAFSVHAVRTLTDDCDVHPFELGDHLREHLIPLGAERGRLILDVTETIEMSPRDLVRGETLVGGRAYNGHGRFFS